MGRHYNQHTELRRGCEELLGAKHIEFCLQQYFQSSLSSSHATEMSPVLQNLFVLSPYGPTPGVVQTLRRFHLGSHFAPDAVEGVQIRLDNWMSYQKSPAPCGVSAPQHTHFVRRLRRHLVGRVGSVLPNHDTHRMAPTHRASRVVLHRIQEAHAMERVIATREGARFRIHHIEADGADRHTPPFIPLRKVFVWYASAHSAAIGGMFLEKSECKSLGRGRQGSVRWACSTRPRTLLLGPHAPRSASSMKCF